MNRRIIYSRPDGGVSIVIPVRSIEDGDLTDEQIFQRALAKLPMEAINPQTIMDDQIPQDRTFRNAWEHGGDKVQINMVNAQAIHMDRIRKARDVQLAALDVDTIKAIGMGDNKAVAEVEARKQVLRNIPQTLDLTKAATPEELVVIWPTDLSDPVIRNV